MPETGNLTDEALLAIIAVEPTDPDFSAADFQAAFDEMERRRAIDRGEIEAG
jgi:hypothetical protein